jgi:hypothetical protein
MGNSTISQTQIDFAKDLEEVAIGIDSPTASVLSYSTVAGWLGNCPLKPKA